MTQDEKYMREALKQARKAAALGETPIGCVIVSEGRIIARGYNRRKIDRSTLAHAELIAIRKACRAVGDWRLEGCTMYVTLEPCQMCAGALVQSRIDAVVIGCMSPKSGSAGTLINILDNPGFNHQVEIRSGVLEEECSTLLKDFFKELRVRVKAEKLERAAAEALGEAPAAAGSDEAPAAETDI
ncbi:MAG: tRNA adenosine(34) deaminase TadA [Lachnospiraceae bacterium]|nr:tRNA adenosine(34) deaminase TadA [Lachnospiraceae bacterium]